MSDFPFSLPQSRLPPKRNQQLTGVTPLNHQRYNSSSGTPFTSSNLQTDTSQIPHGTTPGASHSSNASHIWESLMLRDGHIGFLADSEIAALLRSPNEQSQNPVSGQNQPTPSSSGNTALILLPGFNNPHCCPEWQKCLMSSMDSSLGPFAGLAPIIENSRGIAPYRHFAKVFHEACSKMSHLGPRKAAKKMFDLENGMRLTIHEGHVIYALHHYVRDARGNHLAWDDIDAVLGYMRGNLYAVDAKLLMRSLSPASVADIMKDSFATHSEWWITCAVTQYAGYMVLMGKLVKRQVLLELAL